MRVPPAVLRAAAAIASCLAAGSALSEPPAPRCSIEDAEDWREYRSAHFVVATDVPRDRAARLVEQLERMHALVVAALFGEPVDVPGRVHAVAFRNARHFRERARKHAGGYVAEDAYGQKVIVFPFAGSEPVPEVVAHELAHLVSWHHYPRRPRWFSEGLALFVQSVAEERGGGERRAGSISPLIAGLLTARRASAKDLLAGRHATKDLDPGGFHAGSWLLYHYLWNERSKAFSAYQARLSEGEAPAAAWLAAFPEYDPADAEGLSRLDAELDRYRRVGRYLPYPVVADPADASFSDVAISSADLHELLLAIHTRSRWPSDPAEVRALEVADGDEALREDPLQPLAVAHRAYRADPRSVAAALRAVTAGRPEDFRGWCLLASALEGEGGDPQEKEAALRRAVALAPDNARVHNDLAWLLVRSGRAKEARPFAERALDLAPWNRNMVDTLAAVAFGIGQCRQAVILQRRAGDLFQEDGPVAEGVRQRLAEYEARCGAPAPAPAGAAK